MLIVLFVLDQLVVLIIKSTNLPVPTLILLTHFFSKLQLGKSVESVEKARKGICQIPDVVLNSLNHYYKLL